MYFKEFEIRWNDLDANKHLGNSSYIEYMSHTRMSFLTKHGMSIDILAKNDLGPIVLYEHIHYFREIRSGQPIRVSLEAAGYTKDVRFVKFYHNFYDTKGKHLAHAEILFSFIQLSTRKLGKLPQEFMEKIKSFPKSESFKILTKTDTFAYGRKPKDLV
jgi:acyl-CoA thioester hydrolase